MGTYFSKPLNAFLTITPAAFSVFALGIYKFQTSLIYPSDFPPDSRTNVDTPASYNIPYEDVTLTTADKEKLKLFVMLHNHKESDNHPSNEEKDGEYIPKTIVMLGPNSGNMGHSLPIAELFYKQMNYNVVMVSYRGYGLSTGKPSESGIKVDASTILGYLAAHPQISESSIVLYGRSLGGAVAIYMSSLPGAASVIKGVMLENTFLSITKLIPSVLPSLSALSWLCTEKWQSEKIVSKISKTTPMLFLSGSKDELVPPAHMQTLYDLAKSENKGFKEYSSGTHNDTCLQRGYWDDVVEFLARNVEPVESR